MLREVSPNTIINDSKEYLKQFSEVLVVFKPRSANIVTHLLVKTTYSMSGFSESLVTVMEFIMYFVAAEAG